jgi:hypothetical protein
MALITRKQLFGAAFITMGVIPIIPIVLDCFPGPRFPKIQTVLVVTVIYSVTIGTMPESTPMWAMLGVVSCIIFSALFGIHSAVSDKYPYLSCEVVMAYAVIITWVIVAWKLLKRSYVGEGKPLWGFKPEG